MCIMNPIVSVKKFNARGSFSRFNAFPSSGELFSKLNSNEALGERINLVFFTQLFFS